MSVSILPFGYYIVDNTTGAFVVDVRSKKVSYMLQIMENWSYIYRQGMDHYPKFCKMIHENGGSMPEPFRCWLWCMVAGMLDIRAMNPKLFHKSLDTYERSVLVKYASVDASIRLDLHRTYPEFPLFQQRRGIDNMAEVLQALAVVHPDVGYCQGMNFVAGALLQCGLRTEDAFWVFHSLLSSPKHLQGYYDGSLRQVRVEVGILELLIGKKFRKYSQHVAKHGVQWGIVAPPWFIGLFLNIFPWESSCRVFEMFMIYGRAFMFSFCLAVVETNKKRAKSVHNFEGIMYFLSRDCIQKMDVNALIRQAMKTLVKEKEIRKFDEFVSARMRSEELRRTESFASAKKRGFEETQAVT